MALGASRSARFYAAWTGASTAAGLALALSSDEVAERTGAPTWVSTTMLAAGVVLFSGAVLALTFALTAWLSQRRFVRATRAELARLLKHVDYETRIAGPADLGALRDYVAEYFGENVSPLPLMFSWTERNPETMHLIFPRGQDRIVGAFVILPLTKSAERHLESEILDGSRILPEHIARHAHRASCFYVGSVIGDSMHIRALALQAVRTELAKVAMGKKVFARPVSKDGMRICRKWGFQPVASSADGDFMGRIHCVAFHADTGRPGFKPL